LGFNVAKGFLKKALVKVDSMEYEAYVFAAESFKAHGSRSSFENYYRYKRLSPQESPLDFCKRHGWSEEIFMMFVFDYLIINRDRHGANLEVLKNAGKKLSPLYDNGLSFVCANTEAGTVDEFDIMMDRPVNNFIGARSLGQNLKLIDLKLHFNKLDDAHEAALFGDLDGVLEPVYFEKIWNIIKRRWDDVEEFRFA
jgi:hypothetical protein